MKAHDPRHVPDVILEQYRLGELPADEADRIERLSREDDELRRRIEALDRSDEDIAQQYSPAWLGGAIRERLRERTRVRARAIRRGGIPLVMAAVAVVLVFTVPRAMLSPAGIFRMKTAVPNPRAERIAQPALDRTRPADAATTRAVDRIKGQRPSLAIYRGTERGSETLADGNVARPGDLLRIGYTAAGREYGLILSVDGRGTVTLHLPSSGAHAAALRRGGPILLDHAYELDDAPAWERFYFITGDAAFEVAPILDAVRRAAARDPHTPPASLSLPPNLDQAMFSLQKEVRP